MTDIIELLPDHVANQIAAGEVVQRPASVVKELLENSIDAGGQFIKLIIKDAGKSLIQVIDDGSGMSSTDARLSFERHATSKIKSAEDLFSLSTKGFRGEALASIAAIAHVEMKTKRQLDELGTEIIIEGSEIKSQEVVVTPAGSSIAVKHLFYNIPARRNFLKSQTVEARHIIDEFHRVALAHPNVGFSLYHNGSELFNLPTSNHRQRVVNIFGNKTNEKLVPVNESTEVVTISGFVGKPEYAKKSKAEQFFFVNDRFIKSPYLNHAIKAAFEGLVKDGRQPSYFLYLTVDPKSIDINIHPTKTEIKFDDEHTLYAILRSAVKHSLGQFNISPVLDFESNQSFNTPYSYKPKDVGMPSVEVDREYNPFREEKSSNKFISVVHKKPQTASWESLYVGLDTNADDIDVDFETIEFESGSDIKTIFADESSMSSGRKSYQFHNKYIISSVKSGMLVIDQHRAHQRILYEGFLRNTTKKESVSQQLLFPLKLNYSTGEIEIIQNLKEDLELAGFSFNIIGNEQIEMNAVPMNVPESEVSIILEQLISDVNQEIPESNFSASDMLSKSMAKSLAIKSGQILNQTEQEHLVNSLFACKQADVSPTNKPTFITFGVDEIDRKFR
ncbi:DNA mismatch repair protein MutL [Flavobacteriaceae bacterium MAR_2010_188]|nr:DNA mismatch repair protein MutL [Flavobacteriaceae bacterium MAR_2010_188]